MYISAARSPRKTLLQKLESKPLYIKPKNNYLRKKNKFKQIFFKFFLVAKRETQNQILISKAAVQRKTNPSFS